MQSEASDYWSIYHRASSIVLASGRQATALGPQLAHIVFSSSRPRFKHAINTLFHVAFNLRTLGRKLPCRSTHHHLQCSLVVWVISRNTNDQKPPSITATEWVIGCTSRVGGKSGMNPISCTIATRTFLRNATCWQASEL